MKGSGTSVTPISSGVKSDIERLLQKFIDITSVRYEHFAKCFREMKFSLIFSGRTSENELKEFIEKTFLLALSYCFPPYSFQVHVGGAYLLYALYYLQPKKYKMQIRITAEQIDMLKALMNELKEQQHLDACYVLNKLFRDQAFYVCAFPEEHNPLNFHRFDSKEDVEHAIENLRNTETYVNEFSTDKLIPQLETLHEQYVQLKKRLFGEGELPEALALVSQNPVHYIKTVINECESKLEARIGKRKKIREDGTVETASEADATEKRSKLKERRALIKERAYNDKITPRRKKNKTEQL